MYARGSMTFFLLAFLWLIMVPAYFTIRRHMENRKLFHLAAFFSHLLLCVLTWFFMDRIMGELELLIHVVIELFLYGVMSIFFLKELFVERFQKENAKRKDHSA